MNLNLGVKVKVISIACFSLVGLLLSSELFAANCEKSLVGKTEVLPKDIIETLSVASEAFCQIQKSQQDKVYKVRVTGSARSIDDQARYIYQCLQRDGCTIYENQEAIQEYKAIENVTPIKLRAQIKDQLSRNCFISKHLSSRAVDIGTRGMPKKWVDTLAKLIGDTEYYFDGQKYKPQVINRNHGTGPHLHINFKPYFFDPSRCPKDYGFRTD